MKITIKKLTAYLFLFVSFNTFAYSNSANYQLGYGAFDGGGGVALSSSYNLNASAIGTVGGGADGTSSNYMNNPASRFIDNIGW